MAADLGLRTRKVAATGRLRWVFLGWIVAWTICGAASAPVSRFQTGPGQFDVVAAEVGVAADVTHLAAETWDVLREPLGLGSGFSSPIWVRVLPVAADEAPSVVVDTGGAVTLQLVATPGGEAAWRRGLVRALLVRKAVALAGAGRAPVIDWWLEVGLSEWVRQRVAPAWADAWAHDATTLELPTLGALLRVPAGEERGRRWEVAAAALWRLVYAARRDGPAWERFWAELLTQGAAGRGAGWRGLFPDYPDDERRQQLWWMVGYNAVVATQHPPMMEAREARERLSALYHVVLARGGVERVVDLEAAFVARGDAAVRATLTARLAELERLTPALHPFYRNPGLSLADAWRAILAGDAEGFTAARVRFTEDLLAGREIEELSRRLLDRPRGS